MSDSTLSPLLWRHHSVDEVDYGKLIDSDFNSIVDQLHDIYSKKKQRRRRGLVTVQTLKERIQQVRKNWEEMVILYKGDPRELIKKRIEALPDDEIKRIRSNSSRFRELEFHDYVKPLPSVAKIALGHMFEVANELKENNHYVFSHGQRLDIALYSDLITRVHAISVTGKQHPLFRVWRIPGSFSSYQNIHDFRASKASKRRDNQIRQSILSVDGILSSTEYYESAIFFYTQGMNIALDGKDYEANFKNNRKKELFRYFDINIPAFKEVVEIEFHELESWVSQLNKAARINLIAIPKLQLETEKNCFVYRAHPFGYECTCYGKTHQTFLAQLERHQNGEITRCKYSKGHSILTQYRIFIHGLQNARNVRTIGFDNLTPKQREEYNRKVDYYTSLIKIFACLRDLRIDNGNLICFLSKIFAKPSLEVLSQAMKQYDLLEAIMDQIEPVVQKNEEMEQFMKTLHPDQLIYFDLFTKWKFSLYSRWERFSFLNQFCLPLTGKMYSSSNEMCISVFSKVAPHKSDFHNPLLLCCYLLHRLYLHNPDENSHKRIWTRNQILGFSLLARNPKGPAVCFKGLKENVIGWKDSGLLFGVNLANVDTSSAKSLETYFSHGPRLLKHAFQLALASEKVDLFFEEAFDDTIEGCYESRCMVLQQFIMTHFPYKGSLKDEDLYLDINNNDTLEKIMGEYLRLFTYEQAAAFANETYDTSSEEWRKTVRPNILEDPDFTATMLTRAEFEKFLYEVNDVDVVYKYRCSVKKRHRKSHYHSSRIGVTDKTYIAAVINDFVALGQLKE